jgi:hypothetical protein
MIWVVALLALPVWAFADGPALRRWAILTDDPLRQAGVGEQLTVKLSRDGVELVERDQLDKVLRELALIGLGDLAAASQRAKLGQLLRADALLLLSEGTGPTNIHWRALVWDGRAGARLSETWLPAQDLDGVRKVVADTQRRYPAGLQRVLLVLPFVSENLTHEHDHWQSGLVRLLADSLQTPGTAVVELEAADKLATEVWIGGELQRTVPLVVEGHYRVPTVTGTNAASVTVAMRFSVDGKRWREAAPQTIALNQLGEWVRQELAARVLQECGVTPTEPVSLADQFTTLTNHANLMERFGFFEAACGLREAALLLKPLDVPLRLAVVRACQAECTRLFPVVPPPSNVVPAHVSIPKNFSAPLSHHVLLGTPPGWTLFHCQAGEPTWEGLVRPRVAVAIRALHHIAFLALHDLFPPCANSPGRADCLPDLLGPWAGWWHQPGHPSSLSARQLEIEKKQVVRALWDHYANRARSTESVGPNQKNFDALAHLLRCRLDGRHYDQEDLAAWQELLLQPPIPGLRPSLALTEFLVDPQTHFFFDPDKRSAERLAYGQAFAALLDQLAASSQPLNEYYASLGRACYDYRYAVQTMSVTQRVTALEHALALHRKFQPKPDHVHQRLTTFRDSLRPPPPSVAAVAPPIVAVPPKPPLPKEGLGHLGFEPLELRFQHADGTVAVMRELTVKPQVTYDWELCSGSWLWTSRLHPPSPGLPATGPVSFLEISRELAVFWDSARLLYWRQPGLLREVLACPEQRIRQVASDGQYLWLTIGHEAVWLYDTNGVRVATFGRAQGLLPAERGFSVAPFAPGRALLAGSFGQNGRAWIAALDWRDLTAPRLQVVHEMRLNPTAAQLRSEEPQLTADLLWLFAYTDPTTTTGRMLVGRKRDLGNLTVPLASLVVDLDTYAVALATIWKGLAPPAFCWDGQFHKSGTLLERDWVYSTGRSWSRHNLRTKASEALVDGVLPPRFQRFTAVAHRQGIGLIAWDPQYFDRIFCVTLPGSTKDLPRPVVP